MTAIDERFRAFEFPRLLLELGRALDEALASAPAPGPGTINIHIELDVETAAAFRHNQRAFKDEARAAAEAHLLFRGRHGDDVAIEWYDTKGEMTTLFAVNASMGSKEAGRRSAPRATDQMAASNAKPATRGDRPGDRHG